MHTQISGDIGPFLDTVQQRQVPVSVVANVTFANMGAPGSQAQQEQQVQAQLVQAIRAVIGPKMANGQLSFKDLGTGNTKQIIPEILAMSGLAQAGLAVTLSAMSFCIDGRDPQPPLPVPKAPPPAAPQQVNMRIGGLNVHASSDGGIDTAGIKNQLVAKAKSTILWYLFFFGAVVVVLAAVGGYGYYVYKHSPTGAPAAGAPAKPAAPAKPPGKK
jgi:hypothetical protein